MRRACIGWDARRYECGACSELTDATQTLCAAGAGFRLARSSIKEALTFGWKELINVVKHCAFCHFLITAQETLAIRFGQ
jgi:hypothetical protein